jgi:hypothetical protein
MQVRATFSSQGANYEIVIAKPMPRHPLGKYTMWNGVVYEHEMHGDSGIGSDKLPRVRPEIALWGWAEVKRNGEVIAPMAAGHVMVMSKGPIPRRDA